MKIQIVSDLHCEFHHDGGRSFCKTLNLDPYLDVLILAGDIGTENSIKDPLKILCDRVPKVVMVPGNHEFYGSSPDRMRAILAKQPSNFTLLEPGVEVLAGGKQIVGCTLWFPDDPLNSVYANLLSDFKMIKDFVPWVYEQNARDMKWLNDVMMDENTIVVTHHLPTMESVSDRFKGDTLNRFFVCDLAHELIIRRKPALWIHGHTHDSKDYKLGNTRILCNPMGYVGYAMNPVFRENLVVDL